MSTIIIDADPHFSVTLLHDVSVPDEYRRCDICNQLVLVAHFDDHLTLHREIIEDLQRKKH